MGAAAMTDMTMTDATILASLLTELRLPSIARNWKRITEAANREGWPAQKTLATLLEIEVAERASRRIQRHRYQSETPVGKTFASFDFTAAPGHRMRAQLQAIKQELQRWMHRPIPEQGRWLKQVVAGYCRYFAVPTNSRAGEFP